ncbi:MAG: hypothetical protein JXB06_12345 [Spirochaetales bacterium]|nr:hypothetical protein [Spirochaetales bacterium]
MTLRSRHIVPVVLVVFIVGIGGTMMLNLWQTKSSKVPAAYTTGKFAGQYNPADIRGSYSFGDIQEAFAVPADALAAAFSVDADDPAAFLTKSLEDMYGEMENGEIGTDSVRWFVSLYSALPYTPEEDTLLPSTAIAVLQERVSREELEAVAARTVDLSARSGAGAEEAAGTEEAAAGGQTTEVAGENSGTPAAEAGEVKGKTTFGELLSWGVSREEIEAALGLPMGKAGVSVRDFCVENGIEFSGVKEALQAAADRASGN